MEYKKEGDEDYTTIATTEVTGLSAGKYYVRYMKTDSLNASLDKEVVIPEGQIQEQAAPDASGWVISHANTDTETKGNIEGLNDTMEYRKLGEADYTPVTGTTISDLNSGSYQIRYAATVSLKASPPVNVDIRKEAKEDREPPTAEGLIITPPTVAGGNDGRIENVTADMEYRKTDQGDYMPVSGTSIEGLEAGGYELRYAGTDTSNPSPTILIVVPDGTKQEQNPPSSEEVKAVNVSASGVKDGKIIGVSPAMEYRQDGSEATSWDAITGSEVRGLGNGIYEVRYKETATHYASQSLTVVINNPVVNPEPPTEIPPSTNAPVSVTTPTSTPTLTATPENIKVEGNLIKVLVPKVDTKTGVAKGAPIRQEDMNTALDHAQANGSKVKTILVEIPKAEGVSSYAVEFPAAAIAADHGNMKIEIHTGFGTVTVPSNTLKYVSGMKNIELVLSGLDPAKLHSGVKSVTTSKPVIALTVRVDGVEVVALNTPAEIRVPYTPDVEELANSRYLTVSYVAANSTFVQLLDGKYDSELQAMVFTTAKAGEYAVVYTKKHFNDVIKDSWYAQAVETMASKGFIEGTSATSFSPSQQVTRGEYLAWLVKTLGLKAEVNTTFGDIERTDLYYEEIGIAKALGIAMGSNGSFYPETEITRQDLAVLTMRALRAVEKTEQNSTAEDLKRFTDAVKVANYAVNDMAAMVNMGFINGRSNATLSPNVTTTRAEAAQVLYKIFLQF